jgi:hypothetical protein
MDHLIPTDSELHDLCKISFLELHDEAPDNTEE